MEFFAQDRDMPLSEQIEQTKTKPTQTKHISQAMQIKKAKQRLASRQASKPSKIIARASKLNARNSTKRRREASFD